MGQALSQFQRRFLRENCPIDRRHRSVDFFPPLQKNQRKFLKLISAGRVLFAILKLPEEASLTNSIVCLC
jgi:hypothetical protein